MRNDLCPVGNENKGAAATEVLILGRHEIEKLLGIGDALKAVDTKRTANDIDIIH